MTAAPGVLGDAVPLISTDGLPRDAWLGLRRRGIGGSDASAILGLNRYRSPLAVWLDKTGVYTPDVASEAITWGALLEPVVADEFSRRTGVETVEHRYLVAHPDAPHMLANVDRVIAHEPGGAYGLGIYEGKTTSPWLAHEWEDNRVPDAAMLQTQHYLAVTGLRYGWVAVLIGGQRLEIRRVEADPDLARILHKAEAEFWARVENLDPPPPVAGDERLLSHVWEPEPGKVLDLDDDLVEHLRARQRCKAEAKRLEAEAAEHEAAVKLALGDHEYGRGADGRVLVTWRMTDPVEVAAHTRAASRRFTPARKLPEAST